jgi:bifunctional UDP-N-acetylglucosamine pyrophosphorylase / glucosamine-1-phosphate N-acetyltransferase
MSSILPLLLLPDYMQGEPEGTPPIAAHPLLGRPVFLHAMKALESVAGTCFLVPEQGNMDAAHSIYACERKLAVGFAAAASALSEGRVLAVRADMPCLQPETLQFLLSAVEGDVKASFLQWQGDDLEQEPGLRLGGTAYCFDVRTLQKVLSALEDSECTPLDALTAISEQGTKIAPVAADGEELISVRTRMDFANAFACLKERINNWHMSRGVTLLVPGDTYIDADVVIGPGTVIYPGCHLQQGSKIGAGCTLLPNCRLHGAVLMDDVTVESSVLLHCQIGSGTTVGPFAYLRPDSEIGEKCRIGDFVEIKNSKVGDGTKISHLTYVGDGDLGKNINLGCGVVFTNYDGKHKHRSKVEDDAFVGCNVNLVAPVKVGKEAYVAAGSTVTEDVPAGALYVARSRGTIKEGWVEKRKEDGKL